MKKKIAIIFAGIFTSQLAFSSDVKLTLPNLEKWSQGNRAHEIKRTNEISTAFLKLQEAIAHLPSSERKKLRGTHAKGQCAMGSVRVFSDDELNFSTQKNLMRIRMGIFSNVNQPMEARFRFMNADGKIQADAIPDIRSISMDINSDTGRSQHFAFNNVPRFQLKNLQTFADVMKLAVAIANGTRPLIAFGKLVSQVGPSRAFAAKAAVDMGATDKGIAKSYATQSYWSGSAFALGKNPTSSNVIKLGSFPCTSKEINHTSQLKNETLSAEDAAKLDVNYLGNQFNAAMLMGGICQTLFIQFMDETDQFKTNEKSNLIEDTTIIWNGPIHPVAELKINGAIVPPAICDERQNGLNPSQVHVDLPGLGQINRARAASELASKTAR